MKSDLFCGLSIYRVIFYVESVKNLGKETSDGKMFQMKVYNNNNNIINNSIKELHARSKKKKTHFSF